MTILLSSQLIVTVVAFLWVTRGPRDYMDFVVTADKVTLRVAASDKSGPELKSPAAILKRLEFISPSVADGIDAMPDELFAVEETEAKAITLQPFAVAGNSLVTVSRLAGSPHTFQFEIQPALDELRVLAQDRFAIETTSGRRETRKGDSINIVPKPTDPLVPEVPAPSIFRITLAEPHLIFSQTFQLSGINFIESDPGTLSPFNTVQRGSIKFEYLDSKVREFSPGESIKIGAIENGYVRILKLTDEGIHIEFAGNVLSLESAPPGSGLKADLMPTRLQKLTGDPVIKETITLVLILMTLIVGVLALFDLKERKKAKRR